MSSLYREGLQGWAGPDVLKEHFDLFGDIAPTIKSFNLDNDIKGKKRFLHHLMIKAFGKDALNYNQETGDCVSQGGRNCTNYVQGTVAVLGGQPVKFRDAFAPYFYHTSRIKIGGGRIRGAGSLGVWLYEAALKWGWIPADEPGVPQYSGNLADKWGNARDIGSQYYQIGQNHLIKAAAKVTDAEDCAIGLLNGYPTAVCSNRGFNMNASSDGFHAPRGQWAHCMTIMGFGWKGTQLYFLIRNSWADVHGLLKDFDDNEELPRGILRVRAEVVDSMLKQDDSYMYSDLTTFVDRENQIDKALFDLFGN